MKRLTLIGFVFILTVCCTPADARVRIAIDGLHGEQDFTSIWGGPMHIDSLYPDVEFTRLGADQLPLYSILAAGAYSGSADSVVVTVPAGTAALYVSVSPLTYPGSDQYPWLDIVAPDQSVTPGAYAMSHIDNPVPGDYVIHIWNMFGTGGYYWVGTGPLIWDVYPPEDYSAVLELHSLTLSLFVGTEPPHSATDIARLQQMLNADGGLMLAYDGSEPIADKPIIHLTDFAARGARVTIAVPGQLTYAEPAPDVVTPLTWNVAPTRGEVELDYEARLAQPLNFVSRARHHGLITNESWATLRDLKLIEFVRGAGFRILDLGTLPPGGKAFIGGGPVYGYSAACKVLEDAMWNDALAAGMTADETRAFFNRCQWPPRFLARSCREAGFLALYHITDGDYDAIFPLQTEPEPLDRCRVLWVDAMLPERARTLAPVHPRMTLLPPLTATRAGTFHEYGRLHETYGGDALDEMDAWGWHFYDQMLADSTDPGTSGPWMGLSFDTWGQSPLAARFAAGVTRVEGIYTGRIEPAAGISEVVLSGDEDTYEWSWDSVGVMTPRPYAAVVVARQEAAGGRLIGISDFSFFDTLASNRTFMQNVFAWIGEDSTGHGPDIDLSRAVIEQYLPAGGSGQTAYCIHNRGDSLLIITQTPPFVDWLTIAGPLQTEIAPDDSICFTLNWSAGVLPLGYYTYLWPISTNDRNESELHWPIRLQVGEGQAVGPETPGLPKAFALNAPYPNPFNPTTQMRFTLGQTARVTVDLYNLLGERVARLSERRWEAGEHSLRVDLSPYSAGVYFVRAEALGSAQVRKLVLLK